jgi:hypothetical protein
VFLNHRGEPLTRFGIGYILARCFARASHDAPNLRKKPLHTHSMRHSTAVALLKSGNDLSTISHYLGHASPNTTNRYAKVDLEMKRKAIARVKPVPRQSRTAWSKDPTVLDWLESLYALGNVELEPRKTTNYGALACQLHISDNFTFGQECGAPMTWATKGSRITTAIHRITAAERLFGQVVADDVPIPPCLSLLNGTVCPKNTPLPHLPVFPGFGSEKRPDRNGIVIRSFSVITYSGVCPIASVISSFA